jgi:hypothetical protein
VLSPEIASAIYLSFFAWNTKGERILYIVSTDIAGFIDRFLVLATLFQLRKLLSVECWILMADLCCGLLGCDVTDRKVIMNDILARIRKATVVAIIWVLYHQKSQTRWSVTRFNP